MVGIFVYHFSRLINQKNIKTYFLLPDNNIGGYTYREKLRH